MFTIKTTKKSTTAKTEFIGFSMQGLESLKPGKDYLQALQACETTLKGLVKAYDALEDGIFTNPDIIKTEVLYQSLKVQAESLQYGYEDANYNGIQIGQILALSLFLDGDGLPDVIESNSEILSGLHDELVKIGRRFQADILKEDNVITLLEKGELSAFKGELQVIYDRFFGSVKPSNASVAFILLSCLRPKTTRKDDRALNGISVARVSTLEKAVLTDIGQKLCKLPNKRRNLEFLPSETR